MTGNVLTILFIACENCLLAFNSFHTVGYLLLSFPLTLLFVKCIYVFIDFFIVLGSVRFQFHWFYCVSIDLDLVRCKISHLWQYLFIQYVFTITIYNVFL